MSVVRTGNANAWQRGCSRLLVGILLTQAVMPVGFANTSSPSRSIESQVEELESLAAFSADVRRTLDRTAFEIEPLLESLDLEAEAAFGAYVKHGAVKATDSNARTAVKTLFEPLPVVTDVSRNEVGAMADFIGGLA